MPQSRARSSPHCQPVCDSPASERFRAPRNGYNATMDDQVTRTDEEWRRQLTPEQYRVLRQRGTEGAFTGALWDDHEPGRYLCAACGSELFRAEDKFESGTGWPSFTCPRRREPSPPGTTRATAWSGSRSIAGDAAAISGIDSRTARNPPANAIASIPHR
jgi:hypothetical protein